MDRASTIAILLATYNGERFIRQQLDSILAQTYKHIKIYISDDCSTDSTVSIIEEYKDRYPSKIFFSVNKTNIGFLNNFEQLIKDCKYDYIALCDQDDIWLNEKLELQMFEMLKMEQAYKNKPCLVHSDLEMVDSCGKTIYKSFFDYRRLSLSNKKELNKIVSHNGVMGCTILFNNNLKNKIIPFDKNIDLHDYWIALINEIIGHRVLIDKPLVKYRIHDSNCSNSNTKIYAKKRNIFNMFFNNDKLPFVSLGREYVLENILNKFKYISTQDKIILLAFIEYLKGNSNPVLIFIKLIRLDLIRADIKYRIKIFIKLIKRKYYEI
jgi:rhamnosyltransferase